MNIFEQYLAVLNEQFYVFFGIIIVLCILFIIGGKYIQKQDPIKKPSKFMIIIDLYYGFINGLHGSIFKGYCKNSILPYAAMLIVFIFAMNWIPLFLPVKAPTTDYNVPLGLVVLSFSFKYIYEFKFLGVKQFFKEFIEPNPVMLPLSLLDIIAKPVSMSMRLFGNITSGGLILMVVYWAAGNLQNMIIPGAFPMVDGEPALNVVGALLAPPLHFYLDMFAGTIQAFVFTLLTLIFASLSIDFEKMRAKEEKEY